MRLALPLLTLSLLLTACPGPSVGDEDDGTAVCPQAIPGGVPLPASVRAASVVQTQVPTPDWTAPHVPGRVLVVGAGGTLSAQGLSLLSTVRTQRVTDDLTLAVTPAGETDRAFAGRLTAAGLRAQPDFIYRALAAVNDPGYPGNEGFINESRTVTLFQDYLPRINAEGAWDFLTACGKTPMAALTAVLDSGADGSHEDLNGRLLSGATFNGGTAATQDSDGHGTAVTGLLGATTNNDVGLAGVTWSGRNVLPVKVLEASSTNQANGSTSTLAAGLNYAVRQGAKVINMSLGFAGEAGSDPGDQALEAALNSAAQSAVLVAAAGNTPNQGVYYPANNPNVIAVGALGASNTALACYSARPNATQTRALDLVAPGGAGAGVCSGATASQDMLVLAPGDNYALSAGTSEAAPLVSGVAALMRAANPSLTAAQTRALLVSSANSSGGLPLLDAEAAVRAATQ
ncbi:S8 family serine peptidase [Deinococcus sp. YIM 134068]